MKNKKIWLLFFIIYLVCAFLLVNKIFQNDTFFTIVNGNNILKYGITDEERLVWHEGLKFTNPRWLFDVIVACIYNNFGFSGLYYYSVIAASITMLLYAITLNTKIKNPIYSGVITTLAMIMVSPFFSIRAQSLSMIFMILDVFLIFKYLENYKLRYFIGICISSILLLNVHSSIYIISLLIVLPFLAEGIVNKYYKKDILGRIETKEYKIFPLIILLVIMILIGIICKPSCVETFSYIFKNMGGISKEYIIELKPLVLIDRVDVVLLLIVYAIILMHPKVKLEMHELLFILGFLFLSFISLRSLLYFYLISTVFIFIQAVRLIKVYIPEDKIELMKKEKKIYIGLNAIIIFVYLYMCANCLGGYVVANMHGEHIPEERYPVEATKYIKNNLDLDRTVLFNTFNVGSYLEFNGIKAFIDSRSEIFTEEFNDGCTVLADLYELEQSRMNFKDFFNKYGITDALLEKDTRLYRVINNYSNYKVLYEDEYFALYDIK